MIEFLALMFVVAALGCGLFVWLWNMERGKVEESREEVQELRAEVSRLKPYAQIPDTEAHSKTIRSMADAILAQAETDARILTSNAQAQYERRIQEATDEVKRDTADARAKAKELTESAERALAIATDHAARVMAEAEVRAQEVAGKAWDAVKNAEFYESTAKAMKNTVEGYGDAYLKPAESLLDDLAEEFSHKDAGKQLKIARSHTAGLVNAGHAASCDYVEKNRRDGAERFVTDAYNGKVDSILSRVKHDNYGTLEQEIRDAYTIVNYGGEPFRNARINPEYHAARLEELKWAVRAQELKKQEQEEQRAIREQIREEEKARRDYERAIKEAEKEEGMLRRALERAQAQIDAATDEQRAEFEAQLAELNAKLIEAEEKNKRALSMAQQTKRGHVYIISNVGSFGEGVYKIGLTRRLEPLDRVKELGDASVPFPFDVHAIILADDAPALENRLHKHFLMNQLNKVNHRKEFFRASLADIRGDIEGLGIEAKWTMVAEAQEYRESLAIERAIESDPDACESWTNRQLTLDPVSHEEMVAEV